MRRRTLLGLATAWPAAGCAASSSWSTEPVGRWPYPTRDGKPPLVIAHRGASGDLPEHTLAAYELAIDQGADYIEPDLVITSDGVLVARHDAELSLTTDVARHAQFAARRRTQVIDGREVAGWFVEDFTLAEVRQLRARERWPQWRPQSAAHDGRFAIPTLQEIIDLVRRRARMDGRAIGLYPETKHAAHFAARGLPLEAPLVQALHEAGWRDAGSPAFLQSFEALSLRRLAELTALPRMQLVGERARLDAAALQDIASYAQGIGVAKAQVIPRDPAGTLGAPTALVARAHERGLRVHAWTFRRERVFLPADLQEDPDEELRRFLAVGIDGVFADQPGATVAVVRALIGAVRPPAAR